MATTSACPQGMELNQLVTGTLPAEAMEGLVQHLEGCESCFAKLQTISTTDTLVDALGQASTMTDNPDEPIVTQLIARLKKLTKTSGPADAIPKSLTFACRHCGKNLKVKAESAGKKVKCPGCGQTTPAPAAVSPTAAPDISEGKTVLPDASLGISDRSAKQKTTPPEIADRTGILAKMLQQPDATQGLPVDGADSELWDFLAPPEQPDEIGRLGPYRVLKVLGAGGMGVVFRAEDPHLERPVALKAMLPALAASPSAKKRFLREAKAAAALKHDHVVAIYQVGEDRGAPFLAMEFLEGEPLDNYLQREGKVPLPEILRIGREIAEGLAAAHAKGLIHRDIKPANIWLESRDVPTAKEDKTLDLYSDHPPRVKILDFGLARAAAQESGLTQQGAIIGTPAYMAPEQGRGENVDARCDLFSLGVILYRLCTGQQPFHGTDTVSTLMSVAMHEPPPPVMVNLELPQELSDLVMKLLEKDPANRLATAAEVIRQLHGMEKTLERAKTSARDTVSLSAATPAAGKSSRLGAPRPRRRSPALFAVAALFAILLLGAGGIIFYWQTNNGVVRVEINDPKIKVTIEGDEIKLTGADPKEIRLKPGKHGIAITRDDFTFDTTTFELKRGDKITLKIEWFANGKLQIVQDGRVIGSKEKAIAVAVAPPNGGDYALSFDGKGTVEIPSLKVDSAAPYTLEAYVTLRATRDYAQLLIGSYNHTNFSVMENTNKCQLIADAGDKAWRARSTQPLILGKKTHVAGVVSANKVHLYIDGKLAETSEIKGAMAGFNKSMFHICSNRNPFNGIIDEVRISKVARYDKDFTPAQRFEPDADTLALYHFDEGQGDELKDSSGNNHHGKIVGAKWVKADGSPISASPTVDYALSFDHTGYIVNLPASLQLDSSAPFTVEGYLTRKDADNKDQSILHSGNHFALRYYQKQWEMKVFAESTPFVVSSAQLPLPDKKVHVAGVSTGSHIRLYIDGKLVQDKEVKGIMAGLNNRYAIGYISTGIIDEVRISKVARYDKDFTPAKRFEPDKDTLALYHFDEGAGDVLKDSSGNNHHGKIVGAKWVKVDGTVIPSTTPGNYALRFEATGGNVAIPWLKVDLSGPFSIEGYLTLDKLTTGYYGAITSHRAWLYAIPVNSERRWSFGFAGTNINYDLRDAAPITLRRKNHVAGVFDGQQARLYVNGKLVGRQEIRKDNPVKVKPGPDLPLNLGHEFNGLMSEIRISKVARYDKDFTPDQRFEPDADTLALYHFDEGSGDVLKDSSGNNHHGKIVGAKWVNADGLPTTFPPLDPAWLQAVAAMKPEQQVEAVRAELMKRNPGFDGEFPTKVVAGDVVTALGFWADEVTDLSPLRALPELTTLYCNGSEKVSNAKLADLSALRGLKLTMLICNKTRVSDLAPLQEMKLVELNCAETAVSDLSPLRAMPLRQLVCHNTRITDLAPLKGIKELVYLNCYATGVADLSPLKDIKLAWLGCNQTKVADWAPLKGMPLTEVWGDFDLKRDAELLRSIKTLEKINGKDAKVFWKEVSAAPPPLDPAWLNAVAAMPAAKQVEAVKAKLIEVDPGFDAKLTTKIDKAGVVTWLGFGTDKVTDISPVRALPGLQVLLCTSSVGQGALVDLSPLKGMPLTAPAIDNT